ncbi:MAG: 1,4-alpha-glucan branching protein GlgB [Firmicutes bacterium]|nr:1,4-alpha-glucan branching protein GlgB [Bacillota bacterium]
MHTKNEVYNNLSEELLYLFNNGKLHHAYRTFGAQISDGGVQFTVWVPGAKSVKVVGDFNGWGGSEVKGLPFEDSDCYLETLGKSGVFTGFLPGMAAGEKYKYLIETEKGALLLKSDPFAFGSEKRPATASVVTDLSYSWSDDEWMEERSRQNVFARPMNIYEMHLGSWMRHPATEEDEDGFYTYRELADRLVPYVVDMGYTHVEFLPVMEHPLDASWGYQVTGYYAATSRYGAPSDLMYLIDCFHRAGIGVILDWVPGHFCPDEHGLASFSGEMLYESEIHPDWGTYKFDFSRSEVKSFLLSNAMFWMDKYHADGLRVDGVSSMLYLNFGKSDKSTFRLNREGGDIDLDAVEFIRDFNAMIGMNFPGAFTAAEESSAYPMVTMPPGLGGLGFHFKWNMGWMNDVLDYMEEDFPYRSSVHNKLTFAMSYAFSENYILPLSHDEVVHGKKSLIGRMPGDIWRQFAGLRCLALFQMTHPGKKLNFMGHENAPFIEWREYEELEWFMLQYDNHAFYRDYIKKLNALYREHGALWSCDDSWDGFRWIDPDNAEQNILSYIRFEKDYADGNAADEDGAEEQAHQEREMLITAINLGLNSIDEFRIGLPEAGEYREILSTDAKEFGGNGRTNDRVIKSDNIPMHGQPYSISIKMPVLGGTIIKRERCIEDDQN